MKEIVAASGIGIVAGILGGIFGIGGGILIVPALVAFLGFSQFRAQGTSLVALLAPVGILALLEYHKKGDADLKVGAVVATGFLVGGLLGSKLALSLDETVVRKGFAAFLIIVGAWLFFRSR